MFLETLRDGVPVWTESPARAQTWFSEDGAMRHIQHINEPLVTMPIKYIRPASDPLGWGVDDG